MPAVFTSSAGGDIGGGLPYSRMRGPLRVGYPVTDPGSQTMTPTVNANGTAALPLYSFINQPDSGLYVKTASTTAADVRYSHAGNDLLVFTSGKTNTLGHIVSTGSGTAGTDLLWGNQLTSGNGWSFGYVYIPQTTAQVVTSSAAFATLPTPAVTGGAALLWDNTRKKLCVFSTVANEWLGIAVATST